MPGEKLIAQADFSRGMFRGVARHLIPDGGCYDLLNYLLDDEDGSPYKRGGGTYLSAAMAALTTYGAVTYGALGVFDGHLVAGDRTVVVGGLSYSGANYTTPGIASADDLSLVEPQYSSAPIVSRGLSPKFSVHDGLLAWSDTADLNGLTYLYAGSRKTNTSSVGTMTLTNGSRSVTGVGTAFLTNVDVGMIYGNGGHYAVVASVQSDTQLTLLHKWGGPTAAGVPSQWHPFLGLASGVSNAEWVAGRLCVVRLANPHRLQLSSFYPAGGPDLSNLTGDNYHGFPGRILGVNELRGQAMVFTAAGLFAIRNMAFDLTDDAGNQQQTVEKVDGLVLWGPQGVQAWSNSLVVPARDGIYLVDGVSRPVLLSASISQLYREYVVAGYRPGQAAIFRDTYLLPILNSSYQVVAWLTCRLDAGVDGVWPWTRLSAGAVRCAATRNRATGAPQLLGGGEASGARLASLSWFDESVAYTDPDGSTFTFTLETRDYPTGGGNANTVRKARLRYELQKLFWSNPVLTLSIASEMEVVFTALPDTAGEGTPNTKTWLFSKRGKFIRFQLSCSQAAERAVIRSLEGWVRTSGRD